MPKSELFQVAFVGVNRPNPTTIKNIYRVRKDNIRSAFWKLKQINKNYRDVVFDNEVIEMLPENDIPKNILDEFTFVDKEDKQSEFKVGYDN